MYENLLEKIGGNTMSALVRIVGLLLLLAGAWIAFQVLLTAEELYESPEKIERFAAAVERGSNIDKTLAVLGGAPSAGGSNRIGDENSAEEEIRFSYFFAWIVVLLLLLMISRVSLTAVKTGGELVLYDMQIKRFARLLTQEARKPGSGNHSDRA